MKHLSGGVLNLMVIAPANMNTNIGSGYQISPEVVKDIQNSHDHLLPNNMLTRGKILTDKFTNALTVYPAKGLTGNKNSNFYEFLTTGMVPFVVGSGMLMAVFNGFGMGVAKHYNSNALANTRKLGNKMALGVLFYAAAKEISKNFISTPVKLKTGVDINMPYKKVVNELPEFLGDNDIKSVEYHKVFESVDFPRWDLLYNHKPSGDTRNAWYDKVAKKMGLGKNLEDSDQTVKPKVKEMVTKAKTATTISSYLWAAVGVGLAMQSPWNNLFKSRGNHTLAEKLAPKNIGNIIKDFGGNLVGSAKEMWRGGPVGGVKLSSKIGGRALIGTALAASVIGTVLTLKTSGKAKDKEIASQKIMPDDKNVVVC